MQALDLILRMLEKDPYTYGHSLRVACLSKPMAKQFASTEREAQDLIVGCLLHDLGKIIIPKSILTKPSALTEHEYASIKRHTRYGVLLLEIYCLFNQSVLDTVLYHHERWDGSGYPEGLKTTHIPLNARICAVLDTFDSLTSERPYQRQINIGRAKQELVDHSGSLFDQDIVEAFLSFPDSFLEHNLRSRKC